MKSATEWVLIMASTSHEWVKDRDPAKAPRAMIAAIQEDAARAQREADAPYNCENIRGRPLVTDRVKP